MKKWFSNLSSDKQNLIMVGVAVILVLLLAVLNKYAHASDWRQPQTVVIEETNIIEQSIKNETNRYGSAASGAIGGHQFYWGNKKLKWSGVFAYDEDTERFAGSAALGFWLGDNISSFAYSNEEGEGGQQVLFQMGGEF